MEIKKWNEYTKDEKFSLLNHWFHYYGKLVYTLKELENFQDLVNKDSNKMFTAAVTCYIAGGNSSLLLTGLRQDGEKFIDVAENRGRDLRAANEDEYDATVSSFIEEIVHTYNHRAPDIPLSEGELLRQLQGMVQHKLTGGKVEEIFTECLLKVEEQEKNATEDFTTAQGITGTAFFSTEELNQKKKEINEMIDELDHIEEGNSFLNLCIRKDGTQWTGLQSTVEKLMVLGFATGLLDVYLNVPRENWEEIFDDGMPIIIKNNEKVDTPVVGTPKENYHEIAKKYKKK